MSADPVATIVARLEAGGFDPRPTGSDSYESRCPVHRGSRHNLSIRRGEDGRALVHCHHQDAGGRCDHRALVAALGMTEADLFPRDGRGGVAPRGAKADREPKVFALPRDAAAAIAYRLGCPSAQPWSYHYADGSDALVVYRFDAPGGKTYRPVHPVPGGWRIGDPPGPLPLYRLTELADASRVYVGEGEKVVELIRDLGLIGTTSAHGAKSPQKTDWSPLAGREVILLPDTDEVGEGYVRAVTRLLAALEPRPTVRVVRLPGLPEGGDIAEWREALPDGWGPDEARAELERLVAAAPPEDLDAFKDDDPAPDSPPGAARAWPPLEPGTRVMAHDRGNFGEIEEDLGDKAAVHFVSPSGHEATVILPKSMISRSDDPSPGARPEAEPWPPLRIEELPRPLPFPVEVFPAPLGAFCREAAAAILAPADFLGAAMLAVAGAAIGQSVNVQIKRGWCESALLYIIPVGRPGKAKSPALKAVARPLLEIDRILRKRSEEARAAWLEAKRLHERDPEGNEPPGPEPPQLRAVIDDATRESVVIILKENPRGVLCFRDEASAWVASFNEYKGKGGSDRQFWLAIWGGMPVTVDRKGGRESLYVPFPFVGVLGGIQPALLGSLADGRDDGFTDRILFVFPEDDAFPPQRWSEAELSEPVERIWAEVVRRLHATPMIEGEDGQPPRPHAVTFTDEAKSEWVAWFNAHAEEAEGPDFPGRQEGAWSKMRAHAARFALILSRLRAACDRLAESADSDKGLRVPESDPWTMAAEGGASPGPIEAEDVRGAVALVDYIKSHLIRVHHEMTGGLGSADAKAIVDWIVRKGLPSFREADVGADLRRFRDDPESLVAALKALESAGVVRTKSEARDPHRRGPKPTRAYDVNPVVLEAPGITDNTAIDPQPDDEVPNPGIPGNSRRARDDAEAEGREVFEV